VKRIGLLGGMSWESSAVYYRLVNEAVRDRLGGLHSADCLLRSVDFAEIELLQREGRWEEAGERLADEARALVGGGAELLVLCTNTMHKVADAVAAAVDVPFVHIADTTAAAVREHGFATVGLLATGYTMEQDFYVGRLRERHGLEVLVPDADDRRIVHDVIYDELCVGVIDDGSREQYRRIMRGLAERGAEAILFGCTEIDLLVGSDDAPVPVFDTTRLHAERAVDMALAAERIFHITTAAEWERARSDGEYRSPSLDSEGFVHLSCADQVVRVANAAFRGTPDLVLLCVDPARLSAPLRYDRPDDAPDEAFPHAYGPLNIDAIVAVVPFPEGPDGFALPRVGKS
jgi:aspartate racemase